MSAYRMEGANARLICDPGDANEYVEVTVYDGSLQPLPLAYNLGRVELDVAPGAYKVEFRSAVESYSRIVLVGSGGHEEVRFDGQLGVSSAAPMEGSSTSHEYHMAPAASISATDPLPPRAGQHGGSCLYLFVRDHDEGAASGENPALGLSIHTPDGTRLFDPGRATPEGGDDGLYDIGDRWTALHAELDPGMYLLRLETPSTGIIQQALHVSEAWQTQVFLVARSYRDGDERSRRADLARASIFMRRPGIGFDPGDRQVHLTETALRALADGRSVPGEERSEMLWAKFDNPMLGLYGAFLHLRRERIVPHLMSEVFSNLWRLLGPHPDVVALGWSLVARWEAEKHPQDLATPIREAVESVGAVTQPPMLRAAYDALASASFTVPGLCSADSLVERVTSRMLLGGPWLLWLTQADELEQNQMAPRAAPSPQEFARKSRSREVRRHGVTAFAEGDMSAAPAAGSTHADPAEILANVQEALDAISRTLEARPELSARVTDDPALSPLERRLALAAFPETDSFFATLARRRSSLGLLAVEATRPTAADLAASLRVPAGALLRATVGLLAAVEGGEGEAASTGAGGALSG